MSDLPPDAIARTESSARFGAQPPAKTGSAIADIDESLIAATFAPLLADAQTSMEYFFAQLFVRSPELRSLFPLSMTELRREVAVTLAGLVGALSAPAGYQEVIREQARSQRRYGVKETHYPLFADALIAALERFNGPAWTTRANAAWQALVDHYGALMRAELADDKLRRPSWWVGEIVQHERRTPTIAVITIRPDQPFGYQAGQYLGVQVPRWPRLWRDYSIANAPRENGLLDIHVRAVPGGMISGTLVSHCGPGDTIVISAACGAMRIPADEDRDLVFVAGGTGLASLKALAESVIAAPDQRRRRNIALYLGVRREEDFYDTRDLDALAFAYPALTVTRVLDPAAGAGGPEPDRRQSALTEAVATRHQSFRDTDVYLAGPAVMITALRRALAARVPADRLHHDAMPVWRQPGATTPRSVLRDHPVLSDHPAQPGPGRLRRAGPSRPVGGRDGPHAAGSG